MTKPERTLNPRGDESKIVISLYVSGGPEQADSIKKQIEHYASALNGVRLDNN